MSAACLIGRIIRFESMDRGDCVYWSLSDHHPAASAWRARCRLGLIGRKWHHHQQTHVTEKKMASIVFIYSFIIYSYNGINHSSNTWWVTCSWSRMYVCSVSLDDILCALCCIRYYFQLSARLGINQLQKMPILFLCSGSGGKLVSRVSFCWVPSRINPLILHSLPGWIYMILT